ncbi:phosphatidylinositol N-acetylglucosaminyltransferase subunit C [Ochromonadaceae sp. CCMP2298]|nr:phosphatidylinositol N-acetylglucosaminyltransferase subunit C [Ochromonadaceae sp. CCMP2298]|mmetsp:Transcript_29550/g.65532  ORF Transcript_29550/g.65532 Transcript_29550/m.65532 type:complete len:296 (+) Transcript_29550:79-966(+)
MSITVDGSDGRQAGLNYRKPWKRILYEKQNYRDNYIDPVKFLDQLDVQQHDGNSTTFLSLFLSASVVAQQFTVVATFLTIYKYILIKKDMLQQVAILDSALLVVGYGVTLLLDEQQLNATTSVKTSVLFGIFLRISAPILRTLTSSFSEDTIHALAITFSTIHLVFHDYAYVDSRRDSFAGTLSLNAALFTAIILASRLENIELVVSFLLLAVICFSLFPSTAKLLKKRSLSLHLLLTGCQWLAAGTFLYFLDWTLFVVYQLLMVLLWIVGPYIYYSMQVYKKAMRGPWDIAVVD